MEKHLPSKPPDVVENKLFQFIPAVLNVGGVVLVNRVPIQPIFFIELLAGQFAF